jgi:aspartate beta-hydroxylase
LRDRSITQVLTFLQKSTLTALSLHSIVKLLRGGEDKSMADRNALAVVQQLDLAKAKLAQGDEKAGLAALDRALALEPYCFPAMLMKGAFYETKGMLRLAARNYKSALKIMPPDEEISPSMARTAKRARAVVEADAAAFQTFLRGKVAATAARHPLARLDRFDHCLDVFAGTSKPYLNDASLLLFPQLPAIPFFDNQDFPWLDALAARTPEIVEEARRAVVASRDKFKPYVDVPSGAPVNQWGALNRSPNWSTLFFWRDGGRIDHVCAEYPTTTAACEASPLAAVPGHAPTVMYSCLAARAKIPPHTGATNTRLVLHLPLIVPAGCGYRVGHVTREWKVGVPWIFDDTIEHEAWNDSDELRVVLIFDVWNPLLSQAERDLVCALLSASREYSAKP